MESKEINIANILRHEPAGTRLYSPVCGALEFTSVSGDVIWCMEAGSSLTPHRISFNSCGQLINYGEWQFDGECLLFPMKELRDWDVYRWREGDVLESKDGCNAVVFDKFTRSDRSRFAAHFVIENAYTKGRNYLHCVEELSTKDFFNRHDCELGRDIIKQIAEHFNAPVCRYTYMLHPRFKKGDFVVMEVSYNNSLDVHKYVCVFNHYDLQKNIIYCCASLNTGESDTPDIDVSHKLYDSLCYVKNISLRFANGDEKTMLVNALLGMGKRWDEKSMEIVDGKTKESKAEKEKKTCKFEPFDKVLVRNSDYECWWPDFFSYYEPNISVGYHYGVVSGSKDSIHFRQCIPYNDKTKHLVGTTLPYEEQ